MYTQCPECGTVFRVTTTALRIAQGSVRCGICSTRFNALDSLSEEPIVAQPAGSAPEDTMTVEELPGNEMIELSTPPESEPAADAAAAEDDTSGDDDLEFHGDTADLDRLFVMGASAAEFPLAGANGDDYEDEDEDEENAGDRHASSSAPVDELDRLEAAIDEIARSDFDGIEVIEETEFAEPQPADIAAALAALASATGEYRLTAPAPRDVSDDTDEYPILVLDDENQLPAEELPAEELPPAEPAAEEPPPRFLIPEALRRDLEEPTRAVDDLLDDHGEDSGEDGGRRWFKVAIGAALALALVIQAIHFWRDDLARHAVTGPWILRAYQGLGLALNLPADLAAFELRQWGASGDATQPGQLRVRASIVNRAAFAQPYPWLRLSLQDRFGNTIGVRDVAPADYLPGGSATGVRLLAPQQRSDAEIAIVDPGREAVGFEIDVCLPVDGGVRCASERS